MAKPRDYAAEYARRVAKGRAAGLTRQAARGHAQTPEHPSEALRRPERYQDYLRRRFRHVVAIGPPPDIEPGHRQISFDSLEEAHDWARAIPRSYKRIYYDPQRAEWVLDITEGRRRRRKAA